MIRILNKLIELPNHWFVRNTAILQAGSFAGNIIQALAGIGIARILQPEKYGVYALAFGLSSFVSALVGIGIQDAVATKIGEAYAKKDREGILNASAFLIKALLLIFAMLSVVSLILPSVSDYFYGESLVGSYATLIVLASAISTSVFSLTIIALQASSRIIPMSILSLADQALRAGLSFLLVYLGFGIAGASGGHLLGAIIIFPFAVFLWRFNRINNSIFPSLKEILSRIKSVNHRVYTAFLLWVTVDRNLAILFGTLPVLLVGIFVNSSEVTFFKLAFGYISLALSLLGPISVLLNVEFPKMKVDSQERLYLNFLRVTFYSVGLSTLLTLGAVLVSPWAFKLLYGQSFEPSIRYVHGFFIYGALFGFGVGLGPMWRAINKVGTSILINLIVLGVGIPASMIALQIYGTWGGIGMVTFIYTTSHLTSFIYLAKRLRPLNQIS